MSSETATVTQTQKREEETTSINRETWFKFIRLAAPPKKFVIGLAVSMAILSVLENLSPLMTRFAIDHFIAKGVKSGLVLYGIIFMLITFFTALGSKLFIKLAGRVETEMAYNLRQKGFAHLQALSFSYYDKTPVGWILSRMINDVLRLTEVIAWGIVDVVWGIGSIIVIVVAMFIMNVKLALIALLSIPPLILISWFFQQKLLKAHRRVRAVNSEITGKFNEGIMGARTTKTLLREDANAAEFNESAAEMRKVSVHAGRLSSTFMPIVSMIGTIIAAVVLTVGGDMYVEQVLEIGTLYAFFRYVTDMWDPVRQITRFLRDLQSAQAAAERVISLLQEPIDIADDSEVIAEYGKRDGEGEKPWPEMRGEVEFRDVDFSYIQGEPILENFNLHIKAGQTIALVGETGAGKSTLVNLICRFYEPQSGAILIDGKPLNSLPMQWLYDNLGYVLQTPHLFSGSVKDNIRYGKLDATDEEVVAAAKMVFAHDFIMKMENGYDTPVGEGGGRLSTGEKQLISFARAVIRKPQLFVLDEATSSIDTETEKLIQKATEQILDNHTAFIVAHRLSTIRDADKILVIDKGKVVEQGTHDELMKLKGRYFNLYTGQFMISERTM